jgi:PAS domain-containing protein
VAQKDIEVILTRQLAGYLATPIFIVDREGNLSFFNEPAESILGRRFEETGEMPVDEWSRIFTPRDRAGRLLQPSDLPLVIANVEQRPAYGAFSIEGSDGVQRTIHVTAFPLIGMQDRHLGAVAIFWEDTE